MVLHSRIDGRYDIKEVLGQGGMGVVYKAYDSQRKGYVALKTMKDVADSAGLELFTQEWRTLANISHPNIVDVLDSGELDEENQRRPYFVMPLLPGATLDKLIRNASRPLTVRRVVEILSQTCRGLQAAHEKGLIHRDLKPSNLFVMNDDSVKIIDFGMVHLVDLRKSITGIKGTLQYMAPEQLDMKDVTAATDIFSLGVVAYEALTGRKPFDRNNEIATANAIRTEFPPPASELNPAVTKSLGQVIAKAMAKGPWNRFNNAREFGEHLLKAFQGETIEIFDPARIQPRMERAQKALVDGDFEYAQELLNELQSEGHADSTITRLLSEVKAATRAKAIRLLLDSARTRLQEEEFPLAWQKVQEALQKDPGNTEAQALQVEIDTRRSDHQMDKWRRLVHQHLHNQAFAQARQAIDEIRKLTRDQQEAEDLLAETSRREQQFQRTCEEKEQHFQSALRAYGGGEISTALSKLEMILEGDGRSPNFTAPGRDQVYRETYNKIRSEWEHVQQAVAEIENLIGAGNLTRAAEVCQAHAAEHPNDVALQALRLKIEELLRQEKSAYIADTVRRVDSEADLDNGVRCLEEALERYPQEPHFEELVGGLRRRRDFINGIVTKARQYEEQGQIAEALGQWNTIRGIHPRYPGLDFEIERVRRRSEQQRREESKLKWVGQIDRALQTSEYDRAHELTVQALEDFPEDAELQSLQKLALDGRGRNAEAVNLIARAQELRAGQQLAEAIEILRRATVLDPNNASVRNSLADALAERARVLLANNDWRAGEPLIQEALRLCPAHIVAKNLRPSLLVAQRMEFINQCVAQTRELQSAGDLNGALAKVQEGLATYPGDARLLQLQSSLRNTIGEQTTLRRNRDLQALRQLSQEVELAQDQTSLTSLLQRSEMLSRAYPQDDEFSEVEKDLRQRALNRSSRIPDDEKTRVYPQPVEPKEKPPPALKVKAAALLAFFATLFATHVRPALASQLASLRGGFSASSARMRSAFSGRRLRNSRVGRLSWKQKAGLAALPIVVVYLIIFTIVKTSGEDTIVKTPAGNPQSQPIAFNVNPAGAVLSVDKRLVQGTAISLDPGPHTVRAEKVGYKTIEQSFSVGQAAETISLNLPPEPHAIRVAADMPGARVLLDGAEIGSLQEGAFSHELTEPGKHTLKLMNGRAEVFSVRFEANPGEPARLSGRPATRDQAVVTVSNLGTRAFVHSSLPEMRASLPNQDPQPITQEGSELTLLAGNNEITFDDGKKPVSFPVEVANGPILSIRAGSPTKGLLVVESNLEAFEVFVNGTKSSRPVKNGRWQGPLGPADHKVRIHQNGYDDPPEQVATVTAGKSTQLKFELKPSVTTAFLRIEGGTPEAEVSVDGRSVGSLDPAGSIGALAIAPDVEHVIRIQKSDHENLEIKKRASVKDTIVLSGQEARLRPFGTVTFEIQPATADVTIQKQGEAPRKVTEKTLSLPQGSYVVNATADKHDPYRGSAQISPGQRVNIAVVLNRKPEAQAPVVPVRAEVNDLFRNPANWRRQPNGFWVQEGEAWFKQKYFTYVFDVLRSKKFFGSEKVRWTIYLQGDNRIECQLDDSKFSRREVIDGKPSPWKSIEHKSGKGDSYPLLITVAEDRVVHKVGQASDTINRKVEGSTGFYSKVGLRLRP